MLKLLSRAAFWACTKYRDFVPSLLYQHSRLGNSWGVPSIVAFTVPVHCELSGLPVRSYACPPQMAGPLRESDVASGLMADLLMRVKVWVVAKGLSTPRQ
jgi:hypothetical protein